MAFVIIDGPWYHDRIPIDTDEQIATAQRKMREVGIIYTGVYNGAYDIPTQHLYPRRTTLYA
jgi:hypothetical protein